MSPELGPLKVSPKLQKLAKPEKKSVENTDPLVKINISPYKIRNTPNKVKNYVLT
jgi:hypothetical protein